MVEDGPIESMSFEEALSQLEQIVAKLESGDTPLEKSIELYKRGSMLKMHCQATLKSAEERVEKIALDANGNATGTESFRES